MTDNDTDLAEVLAQFTNLIMNERVRSYNEGIDAERAAAGEYYKAVYKNLKDWLAERYGASEALYIANLCDDTLDRSGRLLGEVREVSHGMRTTPKQGSSNG